MADYITTYSKIHFFPLQPDREQIAIEDIAHSLSLLCRANGHFPEFYSVGQHSIACAREAEARGYSKRLILACLLHDAAESYLSDVTRPVKKDMPQFIEDENRLLSDIFIHFLGSDVTKEEWSLICDVDDTLLYYEFYHYMGEQLKKPAAPMKSQPNFYFQDFKKVEAEFLQLFRELVITSH